MALGGNHLPPRMGCLKSFFFWRIFTKKNPKNGDFRYFWGNTYGNTFAFFWARFSFCLALAKVTFRVRWIRWGVKIIDENRHNLLKLFIARSWIKLSAIASTSKLELCCLWPSRRPEQGAFRGCRRAPVMLGENLVNDFVKWDELMFQLTDLFNWTMIFAEARGFCSKFGMSYPQTSLTIVAIAITICPCDCHNVGWIF